jgi:cysteine-rich CPXCG protein
VDDNELEEEFPLGDGTVETSAVIACPYCGEMVEISVDPGGGSFQQYVEDCEICCHPWQLSVRFVAGTPVVEVLALDE